MQTFIFSSEYTVFAANADNKSKAIALIVEKIKPEDEKDFEYALKGEVVVLDMGEAIIFDHSNQ